MGKLYDIGRRSLPRYCWVEDKFGLSWQLSFEG
ncbi:MAG: VOC family protein [Spirochaetaceae bacterium]|nr:VOC family protein [Spirochaetaceae bacterium]